MTRLDFAAGALPMRNPPEMKMPTLMYGIAFKGERTADLVLEALKAGYRGIDSATWSRTYDEPRTGEGVRRTIVEGIVSRKDLFIQTKFSPCLSAERRWIPYDADQPIDSQVNESITGSLKSFTIPGEGEPYLDSVVLHHPYPDYANTLTAYRALQKFVPHAIRQIGVSNASLELLLRLESDCALNTTSPPAVVQNRFTANPPHHDAAVRAFCRARGIAYQAYGVVADKDLLKSEPVARISRHAGVDTVGALYVLAMALGWFAVLDGTSSPEHMAGNLEASRKVATWVGTGKQASDAWEECLFKFRTAVGDGESSRL